MEIQYNPLKKYPKPKKKPIKKKYLLFNLNFFPAFKRYKRTGKAGIFAGSLELVKEGNLKIKQEKLYDDIYIRENK